MSGKYYDNAGHRSAVIGLPDTNGASYQADVNSSNEMLVASMTDIGGVLNATGQVTVTTSATPIIAANTRQGLLITNPSASVTVYVGGSGVTTSNGQPILPGSSLTLPVVSAIYGIVGSSSVTVGYTEVV